MLMIVYREILNSKKVLELTNPVNLQEKKKKTTSTEPTQSHEEWETKIHMPTKGSLTRNKSKLSSASQTCPIVQYLVKAGGTKNLTLAESIS